MRFQLIIDKTKEEQIVAIVHSRTTLIDQIEELVICDAGADRIPAYSEDDMQMLPFSQIECISVINGKTYAIDTQNRQYRLKHRLYELETLLPSFFIRINKSSFANEKRLARFAVTYSGGVDAVFKCGYTEYVSRRCFSQIKRRYFTK